MQPSLVTGAGGFVGKRLMMRLPGVAATLSLGAADWEARIDRGAFEGAVVYHLAARSMAGGDTDFQRDNVDKTRVLAETAARRGAARLVYLSSIKVLGEESPGRPFRVDDAPAPNDAYARSKH